MAFLDNLVADLERTWLARLARALGLDEERARAEEVSLAETVSSLGRPES